MTDRLLVDNLKTFFQMNVSTRELDKCFQLIFTSHETHAAVPPGGARWNPRSNLWMVFIIVIILLGT